MLLLALAGCVGGQDALVFYVPEGDAASLSAFVATIGDPRLSVVGTVDPLLGVQGAVGAQAVAVVPRGDCDECYRIEPYGEGRTVVRGGGPLGMRYGMGAVLEAYGYRFYHPERSLLATTLDARDAAFSFDEGALGQDEAPAIERRGLHLHTLHPIDGMFAFWMGDDEPLGHAILDWAVRNRANHVQWAGLDDVSTDEESGTGQRYADWQAQTAAWLDAAHEDGLSVGIGAELFGTSNLQHAYDLADAPASVDVLTPEVDRRLATLTDGLDWDVVNLSFGEFSGVSPQAFIDTTNLATALAHEHAPQAQVTATVHLGNYPDLQVEYAGETTNYYYLVKYADPSIVPWVHTTMYYNLFEDAGGAYGYDDFHEHRAFLEDRLCAGQRVGYFPESAYWVAFDDSVPTWLPVYARSRWTDLRGIQAAANDCGAPGLADHELFSTGWEWGYWQNDYLTLRMQWAVPDSYEAAVADMWAPLGDDAGALTTSFTTAADAEHDALIQARLAPYLAGRDDFIDLGDDLGVIAQPDRPEFSEVLAWDDATRAAFGDSVVAPLRALSADLDRTAPVLGDLVDARSAPWAQEQRDGAQVTALRARFVAELYDAVLTAAQGGDPAPAVATAQQDLEAAQGIVSARDLALHASNPTRLVEPGVYPTLYQYGYLYRASDLCYWRREYTQVTNLLLGTSDTVPGCAL